MSDARTVGERLLEDRLAFVARRQNCPTDPVKDLGQTLQPVFFPLWSKTFEKTWIARATSQAAEVKSAGRWEGDF